MRRVVVEALNNVLLVLWVVRQTEDDEAVKDPTSTMMVRTMKNNLFCLL